MASTHALDPDPLDDLCPICGERITDDQEWTRIDGSSIEGGRIAHLECVERGASTDGSTERKP